MRSPERLTDSLISFHSREKLPESTNSGRDRHANLTWSEYRCRGTAHRISNNDKALMRLGRRVTGNEGTRANLARRPRLLQPCHEGRCGTDSGLEFRVGGWVSGFGDGGFGEDSATCRVASALPSIGRIACCATHAESPTAASGSEIASEAGRRLLHHGALRVPILYSFSIFSKNKSSEPFGTPE